MLQGIHTPQGIHTRAPAARVYVLNYAAIFPETGFGCWPQMPVGFADVPYLRAKQKQLNAMIANQATATRWVEPLAPVNSAAPIHPNARGMRGAANALVAAIG